MPRFEATLLGAREVGFTVLSMSLSLIAVFMPIMLMGGIVGRFFNEFGIVLSAAVLISLVVSLTTTPMMCANLDLHKPDRKQGWLLRNSGARFPERIAPLRSLAAMGARQSRLHHDRARDHHRAQFLSLHHGAQGLHSAARTPATSTGASAPTRASPSS